MRAHLAENGITNRQYGDMAGISEETAHRWMNGGMTFEGYFRTCVALDVPFGSFMD